jgi:DNA sulfur modification protein DndE
VRLSKQEVDILNSLKRKLRINQWNILCRMAFTQACADPASPPHLKVKTDSGVEMEWETFGGEYAELYAGLVTAHQANSESVPGPAGEYFRRLLFKGILALKMQSNQ